MTKLTVYIVLFGYVVLFYLLILSAFNLYTPSRNFDLPNILWFVHLILLYIHEAGHVIFSLFGKTVGILGGSLNQVLVPAVWYLVAKREESALSNVAIFFTGVSIIDVSIYVKDAESAVLPLIGGLSISHHDWRNLLRGWDLLEYGFLCGELLFWSGMFLSLYGLYRGVMRAWNEPAQINATLNE